MTTPPFNELRLKPGEKPTQERLEELFEGYARNFEDLYQMFPLEASDISGGVKGNGARIVRGAVSSAGAPTEGSGFTASKSGTGIYTVVFTPPFATVPEVVGVDAQGTQRTFCTGTRNKAAVTVVMSNGAGAAENIAFSFIAIG